MTDVTDNQKESIAAAEYQTDLDEATCENLLKQGWVLQIDKVTGPRWLAPPHLDWNKPTDSDTEITAVAYGEIMTRNATLTPEQRPVGWENFPTSSASVTVDDYSGVPWHETNPGTPA